jgi:hypothetical protein
MGLDMHLTGKRYISKYFDEGDADRAMIIAQFPEGSFCPLQDKESVKEVRIEAAYWRKANQIHKWFVDNVQGGKDECEPHHVSREQLKALRETCQRVLDFRHLATEQLPTSSGFYFGITDIDEYYWQDLEHTVKMIDDCLALPNAWEFEYCSSW